MRRFVELALPLAIALALALVGAEARADGCLACHRMLGDARLREPALAHGNSAHQDEAIGCAGCHGGDPDDPTAGAHEPKLGFVARPARDTIAATCGGCHADARFVRRLAPKLPIDQLTLYQLSRHGASSDENAPTCTSCHGVHDIKAATDPDSRVHAPGIAALCGGCHADREAMARSGLPTAQLAGYQRSVHAAALARGVPDAPTCSGCHGNHGALPAAVGSVRDVCGSCHARERALGARGPHGRPFAALGLSGCTPCHGEHDVAPASATLLGLEAGGACARCHARDDTLRPRIEALAARLAGARARAARARDALVRARAEGLLVSSAPSTLAALDEAERNLGPAAHALSDGELDAPTAAIEKHASALDEAIARASARRNTARRGEGFVVGLAGLLFLLSIVRLRRLARRRKA